MKKTITAAALCVALAASISSAGPSGRGGLAGDYQRVILVSWDGVRRDVLHELLEVADASQPCWDGGTVFPMATGLLDTQGAPTFTCLPALAGAKPSGVPDDSPAYGPFQVIASHTTNDGTTFTKPQHASMLSGYNTEDHGLTTNVSTARMPEGITIYERLMDEFDPAPPGEVRDGFLFRTHHSADRKYIGTSFYYWAKRSRALQVITGHGSEEPGTLGSLQYADKSFARWKADAALRGTGEPSFFMFLHFKATDWAGHLGGDRSRGYRQAIVETDRRLYLLMEMLRKYGWSDTAVLVSTDHGFAGNQHSRNGGRSVFNTWMAARNVHLTTAHIPTRNIADYCLSTSDPDGCMTNGPEIPMPLEDMVPNVYVTDVVPTILDMFGVPWRSTTGIVGDSLYRP